MMKRIWTIVVLIFCTLFAFSSSALGDKYIDLEPGRNDLSREKAIQLASEFFSQKCGLPTESLLDGDWESFFRDPDAWDTELSAQAPSAPFWTLLIQNIPNHESGHVIHLSNAGELIYWEAHDNLGYNVTNPDILENATFVDPLSSDVQKEEVIYATEKALLTRGDYTSEQMENLDYEASFIYHEQFNRGKIPVWIIYVINQGNTEWKAVYGYNGYPMSLVPFQQDFICYQLPGEDFWVESFGQESYNELVLLSKITLGTLSKDESEKCIERWRPYLEEWIATHPYYLNDPGYEYELVIGGLNPNKKTVP